MSTSPDQVFTNQLDTQFGSNNGRLPSTIPSNRDPIPWSDSRTVVEDRDSQPDPEVVEHEVKREKAERLEPPDAKDDVLQGRDPKNLVAFKVPIPFLHSLMVLWSYGPVASPSQVCNVY